MILIGISGRKESGKDTVYLFIKELLGETGIIQLAFANELKYEVAEACGLSINSIEINKKALRPLLQAWGTDFKRNLVDKDYWVKKIAAKINRIPITTKVVVITDVRFHNEASFIRDVKGFVIRVNRPSDNKDTHISETELYDYQFDYTINNTGTLKDLKARTKEFLVANKIC